MITLFESEDKIIFQTERHPEILSFDETGGCEVSELTPEELENLTPITSHYEAYARAKAACVWSVIENRPEYAISGMIKYADQDLKNIINEL